MALKKLQFLPGVVQSNSDYAEPGRFTDTQWARFVAGFAEKMGGYTAALSSTLTGVCRNIKVWRDNDEVVRAAFATHSKLFTLAQGVLTDVTPFRSRVAGTLVNELTTTIASVTVSVHHIAHVQKVGDWVTLTAGATIGGLTIAGNYLIQTVPDANHYTITATSAAAASVAGAGGTTTYTYYRLLLGADPIATTSGSAVVDITDANSLCVEGDTVIFDGAAAVGGITLSGAYTIISATTAGYSVRAGSNAAATTTGGGAAVTIENELGVGLTDTIAGQGYGVGTYGSGTYGTPRTTSVTLMLRAWSLANYGEWLLANPRGGGLYVWDPNVGGRAIGLYNAPTQMLAFFVTTERYIVALGKDGDALNIGWPDQLDPTAWTSTLTNTANSSRKIAGGNFIISGGEVRNQTSLIWTDTAAFLHQWRPDDYVFSTNKLGDNCGLFGPNAFAVEGETAYWVSDGQFRFWNGGMDVLPSDDIREYFFSRVDRGQAAKVVMGSLASFNELIVLYQATGETEISDYLLYNIRDKTWATGTLSRTAWVDKSLFDNPMAADASGNVWNHESGLDGNGAAIEAYVVAAPMDVDDGEENLDIMGFLPDLERQTGSLSLYVLTRQRSVDAPTSDGPYTLDTAGTAVDLRSSGKMAGFKLDSNAVGGDFRLGICRVDVQTAGTRR